MSRLAIFFRIAEAKVTTYAFVFYRQIMFLSKYRKRVKILLSDTMGSGVAVRKGFFLTKHELVFKPFTPESISEADIVVPFTISELLYLNENRGIIAKNPISIPSKETILLCDDKFVFNNFLIENGFKQFIPPMAKNLDYPYFLKKKTDVFGSHSYVITDESVEREYLDELGSNEFFKQQIISGAREFTTHILFENGRIVSSLSIQFEFDTEFPIKGKDKWLYMKIVACPYPDLFSEILKTIKFEGICCFNYKVLDGKPFIFEINPRFGGSLSSYFFIFFDDLYSNRLIAD